MLKPMGLVSLVIKANYQIKNTDWQKLFVNIEPQPLCKILSITNATHLSDQEATRIPHIFPNLEVLYLDQSKITNISFECLLKNLQSLNFASFDLCKNLDGEALKEVMRYQFENENLSLKNLSMRHTKVSG